MEETDMFLLLIQHLRYKKQNKKDKNRRRQTFQKLEGIWQHFHPAFLHCMSSISTISHLFWAFSHLFSHLKIFNLNRLIKCYKNI